MTLAALAFLSLRLLFIVIPSLLQHVAVEIRAMNGRMAYRARLVLRGLIMKVWRSRGSAECRSGMALQANDVQITGLD